MLFGEQDTMTDFEVVRREFYRFWFFAGKAMTQAREAKREGREDESRGAMVAFRALSKQAKECSELMDRLREARPAIIEHLDDVAVEQDLHYIAPEMFMAEASGSTLIYKDENGEDL
jgi:hypothetical protein